MCKMEGENYVLWDDCKESGEGISSSGNESVTTKSLDKLSDILTIWTSYT
jgi:hypothetical protein